LFKLWAFKYFNIENCLRAMKRRLCAQSNSNMAAGDIYQVNDSLADLAIHNPPKSCNGDKLCDNSATCAKRRSCEENSRHLAIGGEVDGHDAERENVLSALPVTRYLKFLL